MIAAPGSAVSTIGIYGAGKAGIAIARRALAAGYDVRIATNGRAERVELVTRVLLAGASAVDSTELSDGADLIILAVPLRRWRELPLHLLSGLVVDAMNYWPPVDGALPEFEDSSRTSSEIVRDGLPTQARLVKALNHIGYHQLEELARPHGALDRIALAVASDIPSASETVAQVVDNLGFDPVIIESLVSGRLLQPGSSRFGTDLPRTLLRHEFATAHAGTL